MRTTTLTTLVEYWTLDELAPAERDLVVAARAATAQSYSPYSKFAVGCAVRLKTGEVVTGANQENVSYGLTVCAERTTIFAVNNQGRHGDIAALAVTARPAEADAGYVGPGPVSPCGACRQVIKEAEDLAGAPITVLLDGYDDGQVIRITGAGSLLPLAFGPADLARARPAG